MVRYRVRKSFEQMPYQDSRSGMVPMLLLFFHGDGDEHQDVAHFQSHLVRQNEWERLFLLVCFIHLHHTGLAGVTSYMAGWIFIHLRHRAALTKPHCAYNQKLGAPVCSTLLDDFGSFWKFLHIRCHNCLPLWPILQFIYYLIHVYLFEQKFHICQSDVC